MTIVKHRFMAQLARVVGGLLPVAHCARPAVSLVEHPELGPVTVSRSTRARRISLSVRPGGEVRLTLPWHVPLAEGMRFAESKRDWLERSVEKHGNCVPEIIEMPYSTREHTLRFDPAERSDVGVRVAGGRITVSYPLDMRYSDEEVQAAAREGIVRAWRAEAKERLPRRTRELAATLGFDCRSVTVRNTVSRWGSCSGRNDISLSLHLMRLPDHLIDYIILHELCHTVHRNHGPQFHALLDRVTGGRHRAMQKEMRSHRARW